MGLEIINIIKKEKGMTSKQLSEKSKVPIGTLNKILNGQTKNPAYETIFALAKALDCSVDMFCDKKDTQISMPLLSKEETTLLENYNKSNDEGKKMILSYSDYISQNHANVENEITTTNDNVIKLNTNSTEEYTLAAHDDELDEETKQNNLNRVKEIFKQMDEE